MKKTVAFIISILLVVMLLPVTALAATEPPDNCFKVDDGTVPILFSGVGYGGADTDLRMVNSFDGALGKVITAVWLYYSSDNDGNVTSCNLVIYANDEQGVPTGDAVYTQAVDATTLTEEDWNCVTLTTPYVVSDDSFSAGFAWVTSGASYPQARDTSTLGGEQSYLYSYGTNHAWVPYKNRGLLVNALIRAEYKDASALELEVSPQYGAVVGEEVTLSASIDSDATGELVFKAGDNVLATLDIETNGTVFKYTPDVGEYDYTVEYSGDDKYASATATVEDYVVGKQGQPLIPEITAAESVTATSITLPKIQGVEYSLDRQTWQESNVFSGLTPETTYTLYVRYAEQEYTEAGEELPIEVTTLAEEEPTPTPSPSPTPNPTPTPSPSPSETPTAPATGDTSVSLIALFGMMIIAGAGLLYVAVRKREVKGK